MPINDDEFGQHNSVPQRCGFVAIIGRPNVGKSSLLNALLGKKISITSFKPQTTRLQILGIKTQDNLQTIYVDTPGIHLHGKKALNRQMNKQARQALIDVNAVIFVVEALKWTEEDDFVCQLLQKLTCPIIVALNKIDLVEKKEQLLPFLQQLSKRLPDAQMVPVSAHKRLQIDTITDLVERALPESVFYFPEDQSLSHSEQFHAGELIREKLMRYLEKEIPYSTCVQIEKLEHQEKIIHIYALIWVEREGQKAIIIGERGRKLLEIGQSARKDLEQFYGKKVNLKLWVKVRESWSDNAQDLESLGLL